MKRLVIAFRAYLALIAGAQAADLPARYAAPPLSPPPPRFLFEGFYAGVQAGALGFVDRSNTLYAPTNAVLARRTSHGGSFTGGVLAGYDWHAGPIVFGLRADILGAHAVNAGFDPFGVGVRNMVDVQGSVRGRVGYAFDRLLVFASGGLNVAHLERDYRTPFVTTRKSYIVGEPTVGVGVEYALDDQWRGHVEYRVSALSTRKEVSDPFNPLVQNRHDAATGALTVGVSYRFGK